jgi:uncharacterized protein YndB with AHSA1/START domain
MVKIMNEKVNFSTLVRAIPERVYDAVATSQGLNSWFTTDASVDAVAGGRIELRWKDWGYSRYSGENGGPILHADRPTRFSFQWKADSGTYDTTVDIEFKQVPEGTLVRLTEDGYQDTPAGLNDLLNRATGWGEALTLMKFWVEHGHTY